MQMEFARMKNSNGNGNARSAYKTSFPQKTENKKHCDQITLRIETVTVTGKSITNVRPANQKRTVINLAAMVTIVILVIITRMRLLCLQLEASCLQWSFLLTIDNFSFFAYNWSFFAYSFSFLLTVGASLLTVGRCV